MMITTIIQMNKIKYVEVIYLFLFVYSTVVKGNVSRKKIFFAFVLQYLSKSITSYPPADIGVIYVEYYNSRVNKNPFASMQSAENCTVD
jgi:hypothetical protein